ncbi:hypothetical protein [Brevundimonas olei]|uniref:hypothetical protein n=1 Tax=Brevundimonas olei TaxID=657642 RepID=UPI0031D40BEB
MRIGITKMLAGAVAFMGLMALADTAAAQCGPSSCLPPPPPNPPILPPSPPITPPVTPPGGGGCGPSGCLPPRPPVTPPCGGGGCLPPPPPTCCGSGGGNVNVNVNVNANASANASARAWAGSRAASTVIVAGGGGAYFNVDQPYPTTIQGLNVQGGMQAVQVPFTASRHIEKQVVLQAVCIDDRNVPHPASQVIPGRDVSNSYDGELYRCLAGTKLQWTVSEAEGAPGETLLCNKREALWHGAGGRLECRPEKAARDCNERSLLRRYGAGVKVLTMIREETYTEYREEMVEGAASTGMIMMDGGVGGRVF